MTDKSELETLRADDSSWKCGVFYTSAKDPSPLVPKRYGIGWTLNFGSPWTWLTILALIGVLIWGLVF